MARGEDTSSHPARSSFGDRVNARLGNSLGSLYPKAGDKHRSEPSTGARGNAARGPMPTNTVPDSSVALNARKADEARRAQNKADRASRPVGHIIPRETGGPQRIDPHNKTALTVALNQGYDMQNSLGARRREAGGIVESSLRGPHRRELKRLAEGGYKPNTFQDLNTDSADTNNTVIQRLKGRSGYSQGGAPHAQNMPYVTGPDGRSVAGPVRQGVGVLASPVLHDVLRNRSAKTRAESAVKGPSQLHSGKYFHEAGGTGRGPIMPEGSVGEFHGLPEQASQLVEVNDAVTKGVAKVMKPSAARKPHAAKPLNLTGAAREGKGLAGKVTESKVKGRKGKDGLKKPPTGPINAKPPKLNRPEGAKYSVGSNPIAPDMSGIPTSTPETAAARIAEKQAKVDKAAKKGKKA